MAVRRAKRHRHVRASARRTIIARRVQHLPNKTPVHPRIQTAVLVLAQSPVATATLNHAHGLGRKPHVQSHQAVQQYHVIPVLGRHVIMLHIQTVRATATARLNQAVHPTVPHANKR